MKHWMAEVIETFGVAEAQIILKAASARLAEQDGGTVKDWYAALQAAIYERHPELDSVSKERMN